MVRGDRPLAILAARPRVYVTRDESYRADVRAQRKWCVKNQRCDYIVGLRQALGQAARDLARFPNMGHDLGVGT